MAVLALAVVAALVMWGVAFAAQWRARSALAAWTTELVRQGRLPSWHAEVTTNPFFPPFPKMPFREKVRWHEGARRRTALLLHSDPDPTLDALRRDVLAARIKALIPAGLFALIVIAALLAD